VVVVRVPPSCATSHPPGDGAHNDWTRSVTGNTSLSQSGGGHSGGGGGGTEVPENVWYDCSGMVFKKTDTKNYEWLELTNH
jgi:hypothetical protein